MKKLALLDFDGTLYDSDTLIQEHAELFGKDRAPIVKQIAKEVAKTKWTPEAFADALEHDLEHIDAYTIKQRLLNAVSKDHVYNDVEQSVKDLQQKGYSVVILTRGDTAWQKHKIKVTDLDLATDDVIITESLLKGESIQDIEGEVALFVDDKEEQLESVGKVHPETRLFLMDRTGTVKESKYELVHSMQEVIDTL